MALIDSLKAYETGLRTAADIIVKENPDIIIAPMMGAVPFIDVMHDPTALTKYDSFREKLFKWICYGKQF